MSVAGAALGAGELPQLVKLLLARAGCATSTLELHLTYLRRKPGRGLVAVYRVEQPGGQVPFIHLAVDERALEGSRIAVSHEQIERTESLSGRWPGAIRDPQVGLTLQPFPTDAELPTLATACEPGASTVVRAALADALRELGGREEIVAARVEPVRYKPGDRCAVRYVLGLADGATRSIFGKVYASATHARELYRQTTQVYEEQLGRGETPLLARPLGLVEELGLVLSEDLAGAGAVASGNQMLRPVAGSARAPDKAIRDAGAALARLHCGVYLPASTRAGTTEAARARKRALRIGEFVPELAERAARAADRAEERLGCDTAAARVPAHGSFKPAQLVFCGERVVITDFDQFCAADPALDVGYFLAYLRPPSLWYGRRSARSWFEASANEFLGAYEEALAATTERRVDPGPLAARSSAYEAAVLFKIANRRFNRLQSPRAGELAAILDEIDARLSVEA